MGLYDYLPDGVAERLTEFLYSILEPGGRLLIANYTPEMELTAFIEMFMQWDLIYRDLRQMRQLARRIPLADPSLLAVKQLAGRMILVLELTRPS
jgi:extracellular factor (EF) 3-hydroxypalmitic acid methyl ester biosynthesis protein